MSRAFLGKRYEPLNMRARYFKIAIFTLWFLLLGLLGGRDLFISKIDRQEATALRKARQEHYYGVWFQDRRIGYVSEHLNPEGRDIIIRQKAHLLLNVLNSTQPIDMRLNARLDNHLVLKTFHFQFASPFYKMKAEGTVENNRVHFTLDTGHSIIKDTVTLAAPPQLDINERNTLLEQLHTPGEKIKVPSFDPLSLTGREATVEYQGRKKILIQGKIRLLHQFKETFSGIRVHFWLNDQGRVIKEQSPAGFVLIAEPEFRAKDIIKPGKELLSSVAVPLSGAPPHGDVDRITYRLTLPADLDLDLDGGRQDFKGNLLTLSREQIPSKTAPTTNNSCGRPQSLRPSRYIQSAHPDIKALAASIVADETDPALQTRKLADWLYRNIEKRPVLGLPDALTTLRTKKGDCNEHAALFAALSRSLGIPTVIATGVTLYKGAFYYHAWNEVCLDGRWFTLDTTTNQMPADLFHIRFGRGDADQQIKIGAIIGRLKITIMPDKAQTDP